MGDCDEQACVKRLVTGMDRLGCWGLLLSLRKHRHDLKHNQSQPLSADGVQHGAVTGGTNSQETKEARENRAVLQPLAAWCETLPSSEVPPRGVKLSRSPSGNMPVLKQGSAKSSAPGEVDFQLVALIQAWPTLSKAVQQQIMLLVG